MIQEQLTALVAEDELPIRALLVNALEEAGFHCREAADGEEAWNWCQASPFDLVVTDLKMPNTHGHALCVRLCNMESPPTIAVLTGIRHERLEKDLETRGVDGVYFKPINFRKFAYELRSLVDTKRANGSSIPDLVDPSSEDAAKTTQIPIAKSQAKHVIGILLRDHQRSEQLSEAITSESTACFVTTSSEELCQVLDNQRIDLLLVENELGGFLSGLEIVHRLNQQLIRPKVILLSEFPDNIAETADEIGVERIIASDAEASEIVCSVRRAVTEQSEQDAFIPALARHIVKDFGEIPPLPQLVVKLAGYLAMPLNEIPIDELANDISADSRAATDLLNFTNSGRSVFKQITNVQQAVNLNGPKKTIALILSAATMRVQSHVLDQWNETNRQWYQKRSVVIASAASTFAEKFEQCSPDIAFILGLVQDVGCLVLSKRFGRQYDLILKRFQEAGRVQLHQLELESFHVHHGHVSAALMQKWRLPQSLIRPVIVHHDTEGEDELSKADRPFLRVIQLGEAFANAMEIPHSYRNHLLAKMVGRYDQVTLSQQEAIFQEASQYAQSLCEVFRFPTPNAAELEKILGGIAHTV